MKIKHPYTIVQYRLTRPRSSIWWVCKNYGAREVVSSHSTRKIARYVCTFYNTIDARGSYFFRLVPAPRG